MKIEQHCDNCAKMVSKVFLNFAGAQVLCGKCHLEDLIGKMNDREINQVISFIRKEFYHDN